MDLERPQTSEAGGAPAGGSSRLQPPVRRGRDPRLLAAVAAGVVVVAVAAFAAGSVLGGDDEPTAGPSAPASPAPATSAAVPPASGAATPPSPTRPLIGLSVPRVQGTPPVQVVSGIKQEFGGLPVARVFASGLPSPSWDADPTLAALGSGSAVVYSFKSDVAGAAEGAADDRVRSFLASKPAGVTVWVAFHHEPEDDVSKGQFTAEQFRAAQAHLAPVIREAGGIPTTILQTYTLSGDSGRSWKDYYSPEVDVLAWDAYNNGQRKSAPVYKAPQDFVTPVLDVARETGKPFGWAEFGSPCIATDPECTGRAAWLKAVTVAFRDAGAKFVIYWNQSTDVDFTLRDPDSISAYRSLVTS